MPDNSRPTAFTNMRVAAMATAAVATSRTGFMPGTVGRTTRPFHPMPSRSRRVRVAADLHISVAQADEWLYGARAINLVHAAIVGSDLQAGDRDAVAQWIAPTDAALAGHEIPHIEEALTEY